MYVHFLSYYSAKYNSCLFVDGDLGVYHNVKTAYMKQKHRLLWERRHGRVGCGMKSKDNEISASAEDH